MGLRGWEWQCVSASLVGRRRGQLSPLLLGTGGDNNSGGCRREIITASCDRSVVPAVVAASTIPGTGPIAGDAPAGDAPCLAPLDPLPLLGYARTHQSPVVTRFTGRLLSASSASLALRICALPSSSHAQTPVFVQTIRPLQTLQHSSRAVCNVDARRSGRHEGCGDAGLGLVGLRRGTEEIGLVGAGLAWVAVGIRGVVVHVDADFGDLLPGRNAHLVAVLEARTAAAVALVSRFGFCGAQFLEEVVHGAGTGGGLGGAIVRGRGGRRDLLLLLAAHGDFVAAVLLFEACVLLLGFLRDG